MNNKLYSISELAESCDISTRTIRFYEDKGLLSPQRVGGSRIYNYKDHARLQIILRGKRLGFTLEEIGEYFALYNSKIDTQQSEQIQYLSQSVIEKIQLLEQQQRDLQAMLSELKQIQQQCEQALHPVED